MGDLLLLVIWISMASIYLCDMQLLVPVMGEATRPADRQVWLTAPLVYTLLTLLITPLWPVLLAATGVTAVVHLAAHVRWSRSARRQMAPVAPELAERVAGLCHAWQTRRPDEILVDRDGGMGPFVMGLWRQTLVLPPDAPGLAGEELAAILAHELAHVRRRHPLKIWLAGLARTLTGWHPFARPLLNQLPLEMELEADSQAAAWLGDALSYALTLGRLGLRQAGPQQARFGVALAGRPADLVYRVRALVEPANPVPHLRLPRWLPARIAAAEKQSAARNRRLPRGAGRLVPYLVTGGYLGAFLLLSRLV